MQCCLQSWTFVKLPLRVKLPSETGFCCLRGTLCLVQERAYVTGLRAANMVVDQLGSGMHANILPVEPDEPYIAALKGTAKTIKSGLESLGIRSPFM